MDGASDNDEWAGLHSSCRDPVYGNKSNWLTTMVYFDLRSVYGKVYSYHARVKCSLVRTTYNKNDIHNTQTIPIHTYFHENQTSGNGISKSQTKASRYMPFMKTNRKLLEKKRGGKGKDDRYHIQSPANRAHPAARFGEALGVCRWLSFWLWSGSSLRRLSLRPSSATLPLTSRRRPTPNPAM